MRTRNQNRHHRDQDYRSSERSSGRGNASFGRQSRGYNEPPEWYDRDPMDERSGYRDEERDYNSTHNARMDSSELRGYNDHYRYDQNYHNYYGSANYNPDRERQRNREYSYDSDRYSRGQGAYGTSSSGRASWDTGPRPGDRTAENSPYGVTQGAWSPRGEESRDNFYGRGPRNYRRSDERIKEEICEMLTRHSSIDADEIEVEVKEGEVTLSGRVSERRMRHLAEDCAEQCFGVKDVINNIHVKRATDSDVAKRGDYGGGLREPVVNPDNSVAKKSPAPSASNSTTADTKNPNH